MPETIRVLQLASPSGLYGAEHWILALIRNLDQKRVQSFVAAVQDAPHATAPICKSAAEIGFSTFVLTAPGRFNLSAVRQLKRLIINNRIDILHTHGYKTDFYGLLASLGTRCKVVTTPHGWTNNPDFKLRLYEKLDRVAFMFCDAVVPLSMGLYHMIKSTPFIRGKIILIKNGVDLAEVHATEDLPPEITELKKKGKHIIGTIGRLVPGKAVDIIIRATAEPVGANWHLVIIGTGEQEADLKNLSQTLGIADRVSFLGFRQDRLAYLKGFDCFVLASLSEGVPRCVMEAMAANVPVVASDIEGCRNLIQHNKTGVLFSTGDFRALAAGIDRLSYEKTFRDQVVAAAAFFVAEHFSAARMAKEYEALYARLCKTDLSCELTGSTQKRKVGGGNVNSNLR